jgi:hypothetical protein
MNSTTHSAPPLLAAYHILGRMITAAQRAGDIGREFVVSGVSKLVSLEIVQRRSAAAEARTLGHDLEVAEHLVDVSLGHDGTINPAEATQIRAAFRKVNREARHLSQSLELPE